MIKKIISGGQTGADIAGLRVAELFQIPYGGFCLKGFKDENGYNENLEKKYNLKECGSLRQKTIANIINSDATVIFSRVLSSKGTQTTINICKQNKKPYYVVETFNGLKKFLSSVDGVLNVAGNRESVSPGIQERTEAFLINALSKNFNMYAPLESSFNPSVISKAKELYLDKIEKRNDDIIEKHSEENNDKSDSAKDGNFVHLHVHSTNSLLDGICEFEDIFDKMKKIGQDTIALTDHGYMYGNYKFQKAAEKAGVRPIHGVEAYFTNDVLNRTSRMSYHLILLVMNEIGWKNLCHLMTRANREGFYYYPRVDKKMLREHNEGLICLSACYKSPISYHLTENGYAPETAKENMMFFKEVFGDRFYNEIMFTGWKEYDDIVPKILELADNLNVPTVATNDVHTVEKEDYLIQQTLIKIKTNGSMNSDEEKTMEDAEGYLKSRNEMIKEYITEEMCDRTLEIAKRCEFQLKFEGFKFPEFDITKQKDYKNFLKDVGK